MSHLNKLSAIGIIGGILALFIAWSLEPDIIEIKNSDRIQVDKSTYYSGGRIAYTFEYCKRKRSVGVVDRALVDTYRITYSQMTSDLNTGCHKVTTADLVIPSFVGTGVPHLYYLEGSASYKINPIKTQYVYWKSVKFIVK